MSTNAGISALLERLKGMFSKSKPVPTGPAPVSTDAVRPVTSSGSRSSTSDRSTDSQANMSTFPRQGQDQGYQASRGGAAATNESRRLSSTFHKLQALSASGTGSAGV